MKLVIGFCGRARHGKDIAALEVRNQLEARGQRCLLTSFSAHVLAEGVALKLVSSPVREKLTPADLKELVRHGHQRRLQAENYWVDKVAETLRGSFADVALVTGVRFQNEAQWLHARYGVLARVTRWDYGRVMYLSNDRDPADPMEAYVEGLNWDYELCAFSGDLPWLRWQARGLANYLFSKRCLDGVPRAADGRDVNADVSGVAWG